VRYGRMYIINNVKITLKKDKIVILKIYGDVISN